MLDQNKRFTKEMGWLIDKELLLFYWTELVYSVTEIEER